MCGLPAVCGEKLPGRRHKVRALCQAHADAVFGAEDPPRRRLDAKTHLLRVGPPWRNAMDRTRCGRRVADGDAPHWRAETPSSSVTEPDEAMAARAAADWRAAAASKLYGRQDIVVVQDAPDGICKPCRQNLGCYGLKTWRTDPLEVLRIDLAVADRQGRIALGKELIALANLVAAHRDSSAG